MNFFKFFVFFCILILYMQCGGKGNTPPNAPLTPAGPAYGYEDSTYLFSSSATDPEQDNVAIRFSWGDGDTSAWSTYVSSGETLSMSYTYIDTGVYGIAAQAMDENEEVSGWSAGYSIRILLKGVNNHPDAPVNPSGPASGKVDSMHVFSSSAIDPEGDSVTLRFAWGDGDTSSWSVYVPDGQPVSDSHAWISPEIYNVTAQAMDLDSALSPWSGIHTISIVTTYPPNTPSIPSGPATGTVDSTYDFSSTTTDPDGDNISIRFDWDDGDTSSWSGYVPSGDTVSSLHYWSTAGTYNVKAQARDIYGEISGWSGGHQIEISGVTNNPPNKPSMPSGPTIGWVDSIYDFSSTATDPDGDDIAIRFAWDDGDTSAWYGYVPSGDTITAYHFWSFSGTYYIRAQAMDLDGLMSVWSDSLVIDIFANKKH